MLRKMRNRVVARTKIYFTLLVTERRIDWLRLPLTWPPWSSCSWWSYPEMWRQPILSMPRPLSANCVECFSQINKRWIQLPVLNLAAVRKQSPYLLYFSWLWCFTGRCSTIILGTRMLRAILNKSWRQHLTKQQLYGHQPPITRTIKIRRTRHAGNCWRSREEFISDVLLWTPSLCRANAGRPAGTYVQHLCADTGCSPEDQPEAMDDGER